MFSQRSNRPWLSWSLGSLGLMLAFQLGASSTLPDDSVRVFEFELETEVPLSNGDAFDLFTGDIKAWWDHSYSGSPVSLTLPAEPGGAFFEQFDEERNGAVHARVTFVERGKKIAFVGPLGLAATEKPVHMVHNVRFEGAGEKATKVTVKVSAMGVFPATMEEIVKRVWTHFLVEQYTPFAEQKGR